MKPYRNVCGFWFDEADDPFRWRERLGLARAGLAEVVVSTLACGSATALIGGTAALAGRWEPWLLAIPVVVLWVQMLWFFRDPRRQVPDDPRALLSPADGRITHLQEVGDPDFPGGRAFRVSIYLSPWDVHLNRIPRAGRVVSTRYLPGAFLNALHVQCAARNEQLWTDIEESCGRRLRIKQIAGCMARRIVCWLKPGESVAAGSRFGLIKYGSRTDVLLPVESGMTLAVGIGDRVAAGTTVLLRFAGRS